ncbi:hypothetical protein PRIPAC_74912 [Pristionchus pacificus]|uniref:Uncharacterized protein n=1 Tax=Pristionchus pacificus TaxID=54126 RepID=A0A2A6CSH6_PRIPA|nr:hypothetical protein PRIPAC_74912 [Pristionchus pacificus]|eukprot:PDM81070.1 hypothetical protein PRIPAC_36073 [Pristionchus pacificus]
MASSNNTKQLILPLFFALALISGRYLQDAGLSDVKVKMCATSETHSIRAIEAGKSLTSVDELDSEAQNSYQKPEEKHWSILVQRREQFGDLIIYKHHRINHKIDGIIICDIDGHRLH